MNKKVFVASAIPFVLSASLWEGAHAEEISAASSVAPASAETTPAATNTSTEASIPVAASTKISQKEDRLLKEMVVSAVKDVPVQQRTELGKLTVYTPVSGAVVGQEELEHLQLQNNLLELGKRVPGISMIRNMRIPDGGKQYTESRIDGLRTTSLNTSAFDTVDMSTVERIDVITGPASALYGTGALGGTIAMTSRKPPEQLKARVSQELGMWGFNRSQGYVGNSYADGKVGFIVNASNMDFDGWRKNSAPENSNSAAEHKRGGGIKAYVRPGETTRIMVGYDKLHYDYRWAGTLPMAQWQQNWRQTVAGAYGQSIDDYTTKQIRLQQFIGERGELTLAYGEIEDVSTNYGGAGSGGSNNVICDDQTTGAALAAGTTVKCAAVNGGTFNTSTNKWVGGSSQVSNTLKYGTSKVVTKTILYRHEFDFAQTALHVGDDIFETTSDSATYGNTYNALQAQSGHWAIGSMTSAGSITKQQDSSPFVHVEFTPMDKMRVHFGERFAKVTYTTDDRTSTNKDGQVTKKGNVLRSGVTYEFTPDHIVWGNLGQTFNPPSVASTLDSDVLGKPGRTLAADLNPEIGLTREVGFRGRFDDTGLQYDIALYYLTINDFMTSRPCDQTEMLALNNNQTCNINENTGQVTSKGLESMVSWAANNWLDVGATYTNARAYWDDYVSGTTNYTGQSYQSLPRHHFNLRLVAKPMEKVQVELEGDHISSYYVSNNNSQGSYTRPDLYTLRASYRNNKWSAWLHVINLTDKQYATRVGYSTIAGVNQLAASAGQGNSGSYLPRTVRVGVSYDF